jgi:hypothetical protein
MLGGAAASGLMIPGAEAQVARKRDDDGDVGTTLLVQPPDESLGGGYLAHGSHRSHRSHSSHSSHYSGSTGSGYEPAPDPTPAPRQPVVPRAAPPPPPKPAVVSFVTYPGGRIFVDGKAVGVDSTGPVVLAAGQHFVRVENRFLGTQNIGVELREGQTGVVTLDW